MQIRAYSHVTMKSPRQHRWNHTEYFSKLDKIFKARYVGINMSVETEEQNDADRQGNIEMTLGNSTTTASHFTHQASAADMQAFASQDKNQRQIDALRMPSFSFCNMLSSDIHPSSAVGYIFLRNAPVVRRLGKKAFVFRPRSEEE
ncbi:hypothetical protein M431DRAFT_532083 [Trichoderma harzianum CBS 226.95]|uniref:Uncharacterized protein n=1 Tax=Trichoderma harzianum CBS 226.95 TaxID=983964 RepID=A0A2T4A862_TRIHA|nr:hypothetical protein M431DRAFT_532083 [Trichoderma harzianum CBS 226.95]PTB53265.1 hypothetical protein M431DRAFT_532083 [Trichoderma harzianum CBS 226.95]